MRAAAAPTTLSFAAPPVGCAMVAEALPLDETGAIEVCVVNIVLEGAEDVVL